MKERVEQSKNISKFFDLRDLNNITQKFKNSKIQKFKNSTIQKFNNSKNEPKDDQTELTYGRMAKKEK